MTSIQTWLAIVVVVATIGLALPTEVFANCSTHTYMYGGRMVTCTTCCYFGNCNTNCF